MIIDYKMENKNKVGKSRNIPDSYFDEKELRKGIKVEMEHTNDKNIAKNIAKDHLVEHPNYYKRLDKMENSFKEIIEFDKYGNIKYLDKRYLIKNEDYGYHLIIDGMIHYFDNNKNYERSKFLLN